MFSSCCGGEDYSELSADVVCTDALTSELGGCITCLPHGRPPFTYEWNNPDGSSATVELSRDRSAASKVPPGTYLVTITDALRQSTKLPTHIKLVDMPVVEGYTVERYPTSDTARDGRVRCTVLNVPDRARYMWTNGITTLEPVLENVSPGLYSVLIIDEYSLLPCCHACVPVELTVAPSSFDNLVHLRKTSTREP